MNEKENVDYLVSSGNYAIRIQGLNNGFLVHTPWGRFAYPTIEVLLKELKPQLIKLFESNNNYHAKKIEERFVTKEAK